MKLTVSSIPAGTGTNDDALVNQLANLSLKLDEESDLLLNAVMPSDGEEDAGVERESRKVPFGVVYARDLDAGKAVGYLRYAPMGSVYRIEELYVDREYRRKCIGYSLMKAFYGICKRENAVKINLGCIASNKEALAFYASEGFRVSDASYVLCRPDGKAKNAPAPMRKSAFNEDECGRIWNGMAAYLDRSVNLPEEAEMLREYYADSSSYRPVSICSFDGFKCIVLRDVRYAELFIPAFNADPIILDEAILDGIAEALLRYAKKEHMKRVCISDVHFPSALDETSRYWKKIGCTCFKMVSDIDPKPSTLKI